MVSLDGSHTWVALVIELASLEHIHPWFDGKKEAA